MMFKYLFAVYFIFFLIVYAGDSEASAETFACKVTMKQRYLQVTREYSIKTKKGTETSVDLPSVISFYGVTYTQEVVDSKFTYSIKPDKMEVVTHNRGMPRKCHQLTWKSPSADTIKITQTLTIKITCKTRLKTRAKLPYDKKVIDYFSDYLGVNKNDGINPENKALEPICKMIQEQSKYAETRVEHVCDWINERIKFKLKKTKTSDECLKQRVGSCSSMAKLACAILRRMKIPADVLSGKFICQATIIFEVDDN